MNNPSYFPDFKEKLPSSRGRDQRNLTQVLNHSSIEDYYNAPLHVKTNSQSNILPSNVSKSMAVDSLDDYKNNQYESSLKTLEPKPSSQMNFRVEKTPSIIDKLKQMNEGNKQGNKELHRSISYDKEFVIPSPTKPIIDVSPKISELKNMKSNSSGRLLDSLDKHIGTKGE